MSEAEPKAELDASGATTGSVPSDDLSEKTNSIENNKQLSVVGEVADIGQEGKEQRKCDDEKLSEAGNTDVEDMKVAESSGLNNEGAEDAIKEKDKNARKEESMDKEKQNPEDMDANKEEAINMKETTKGNAKDMKKKEGKDNKTEQVDNSKVGAKDTTKEEVNDIRKDGEDVKMEETVGTKEEAMFTAKVEAKDMKNEELRDVNKVEVCRVNDVDMQDKEVGDETMEEENDVAEEKDIREDMKKGVEHNEAEGEVEAKGTKRREYDYVKIFEMEDQEVRVKNSEEVEDVREQKDGKDIKEKVVKSMEADGETEEKDVTVEEVGSADDVDMEDKEVRNKNFEDKDVTEVKENGEVTKKDEENKEAEKEVEAGDMEGEKIERVIDAKMEDKEARDEKMENYKNVTEEKDNGQIEEKVEESSEAEGDGEGLKKKGIRDQEIIEKGEAKEKKGETKAKEIITAIRAIERPVRERKSVERLVEALDNESVKPFIIEKGRGTPLQDIPNVAYKVSKKKPAQLKVIHQALFGRIGKAIDYKNHILQFSGFVWHESEDKQKTKVKEKLDKCTKDRLLDFCDLFDLPILKARSNARKEELVAMLLDFMVAPHATTDVILSEQEKQSSNSKKRKKGANGGGSKRLGSLSGKRSRKGNMEGEASPNAKGKSAHEMEDEGEEEDKNGVPSGDGAPEHCESKEKDVGSEDEKDDDVSGSNLKQIESQKKGSSADTKELNVSAAPKKMSSATTVKNPTKSSSSKQSKAEDKTNGGSKILSRKDTEIEQHKKEKAHSKTDFQEKSSGSAGKKVAQGKARTKESGESGPSKEELRKTICEILERVDFNTATFTDILKELVGHYGMDLAPRKPLIKLMIQEELTKLAEEDEDEDDESDEDK